MNHLPVSLSSCLSGAVLLAGATGLSAQTLSGDVASIDVAAGGSQTLSLDAGVAFAGSNYFLIGTSAGTTPGLTIGGVHIPINPSAYFNITVNNPNSPPLTNSFGALDGLGQATATFALPLGFHTSLVGLTFHHAYVVLGDADPLALQGASNAVPLDFTLSTPHEFDLSLESAAPGETITLAVDPAIALDPDPLNYCIAGKAGDQLLGFEVTGVSGNDLTAVVGNVPPELMGLPVQVMVATGAGNEHSDYTGNPLINPLMPGWAWSQDPEGTGLTMASTAAFTFEAPPSPPAPSDVRGADSCTTIYGTEDDGKVKIVLDQAWPAGTVITIRPRFHSYHFNDGTDAPYVGYDAQLDCLELVLGDDTLLIASLICNAVTNLYADHLDYSGNPDPIALNCDFEAIGGGNTEMVFELPGRNIDYYQMMIWCK
ncbi:MAG: hypothetical protein AAF682_27485 [Planctomycetota bacterium]